MNTQNTEAVKTISTEQTEQVSGAKSFAIPTEARISPFKPSPALPKEPIFITQALYEDGGHWTSL